MPVPVPVFTKQPAHPVIKINHTLQPDSKSSVFQHLTHSLPLPPQGPPPSFASREEWISSLPSWRRNKPRRVWEDDSHTQAPAHQGFDQGLTAAVNAPVIKGQLAQACIPPVGTIHCVPQASFDMYPPHEDSDEEMSAYPAAMQDWQSEDDSYPDFSPIHKKHYERVASESPVDVPMDYVPTRAITRSCSAPVSADAYARYERGAFSPVLEDYSPDVQDNLSPEQPAGVDPGSSPIGPATPFADYVDNAFAEVMGPIVPRHRNELAQAAAYPAHDGYHASCYQCQTYQAEQVVQAAPVVESVTPVATAAYKKLAAPLSDWIVNYAWKVCTTGMRLPQEYAQPSAFAKHFPTTPPSHLVASTHSMLLSTLLQPSAIFLALWYIVRLPVFFGPVGLMKLEHTKEMRFRAELLGEAHLGTDREIIEAYAPYRLILLGCMLANKWLDDHTFSNKTWHTISNVPIRSLNRLEALALEIFQYDLSITPQQWSDWLSDLMAYHHTLSSPVFPQPISRPSTSPHMIVRQALETLVNARPIECGCGGQESEGCIVPPQPVFVGLEDQKKERLAYDESLLDDVLEIDLDEDGPLREEYLPRRRISTRGYNSATEAYSKASERALPPPAKWSPAADEPIFRDTRVHGQYVAPQPVAHAPAALPPPPLPYQPAMDVHRSSWPVGGFMMRQEPASRSMVFAPPPMFQAPVHGFDYGYGMSLAHHSHARSHSLTYSQAIADQPGRTRSYSQSLYEHPYSDVRGTEAHYAPQPAHWSSYDRMGFPTSYDRPIGHHPRPSLKA
ncbi:hypothetical protein C8Q80DRAFT_1098014 [Daedaleopsis nitida]|nr:hypothetical protein C8Q80DRAFT_1098014 [Daedaleopsis nitida]